MRSLFSVMGVLTHCRSGSMSSTDLRPLQNTPSAALISRRHNNKLGAVYSSLYGFWASRRAAINAVGQDAAIARQDAYSVILFDDWPTTCISNNFDHSPDDLLNSILSYRTGGTDFSGALAHAHSLMVQHWSNERYAIPVSIHY